MKYLGAGLALFGILSAAQAHDVPAQKISDGVVKVCKRVWERKLRGKPESAILEARRKCEAEHAPALQAIRKDFAKAN